MSTVISIQAGSEPRKQAVMHESQEYWFDHEKLDVYREAIDFIAWLSALLESIVRAGDVKDHLDRASTRS